MAPVEANPIIGYWGPTTATIDWLICHSLIAHDQYLFATIFLLKQISYNILLVLEFWCRCEENYVVTPYIAEFWNTVSNIFIFGPCILAFMNTTNNKHLELRHWLSYLGFDYLCSFHSLTLIFRLLTVGVGSWLFHMTLLWEMQLLGR